MVPIYGRGSDPVTKEQDPVKPVPPRPAGQRPAAVQVGRPGIGRPNLGLNEKIPRPKMGAPLWALLTLPTDIAS